MIDQPLTSPRTKISLKEYTRRREKSGKTGPLVSEHSPVESTDESMLDAGGERVSLMVVESDTTGEAMEMDQEESGIGAAAPLGAMTAPEPPASGPVNWLHVDPKALEVPPPSLRHDSVSAIGEASSSKTPLNEACRTSVLSPAQHEEVPNALFPRVDAMYPEGCPSIQLIPLAPVVQKNGKGKGKARAIEVNQSTTSQVSISIPTPAVPTFPNPAVSTFPTPVVPTLPTPNHNGKLVPSFASQLSKPSPSQPVSQNVLVAPGPSAQLPQQRPINQASPMGFQIPGQQASHLPLPSNHTPPPFGYFASAPPNRPSAPSASRVLHAYQQPAAAPSAISQNLFQPAPGAAPQALRHGAQYQTPCRAPIPATTLAFNPAPPQHPIPQTQAPLRPIEQTRYPPLPIYWRAQIQGRMPQNENEYSQDVSKVTEAFRNTTHALDGDQHPRSFANFHINTALYSDEEIETTARLIVRRAMDIYLLGTTNPYFKAPQNLPRGVDDKLTYQMRLGHFLSLVRLFKDAANNAMCWQGIDEFLAAPLASKERLNASLVAWKQEKATRRVSLPPQVVQPVAPPVSASDTIWIDLTGDETGAEDPWKGNYIPC